MMSFGGGDKRNDPTLIGAFGLGLKSPWSLVDQFTVETRWRGRRTVFSAFIQSDRRPGCARLHEDATDEPDGVTITVPLARQHVYNDGFERMLTAVYTRSPVPIRVSPEGCWAEPTIEAPVLEVDLSDLPGVKALVTVVLPERHPRVRWGLEEALDAQGTPYTVAGYLADGLPPLQWTGSGLLTRAQYSASNAIGAR